MIKIKKRKGILENYEPEKFHKKVFFALEGLNTLSASDIEMNAALSITNDTTSAGIQKALIDSCADSISPELPEMEIAAARLLNQDIRKRVYGQYQPKSFLEMIDANIKIKIYDGKFLFSKYTRKEVEAFGNYIKYDRDDKFVYSGLVKTARSYLIKKHEEIKETPQEMFMLINMFAFANYEPKLRDKWVKEGYNILSKFEASLPTPIMIQLRSLFKKFISCNLIAMGDNKETLANGAKIIMSLVADGAGLGIQAGDIRGLGADIDDGRIEHTGLLPILKGYEKNTKAFVQPDRDGSSTVFYPFFHKEIETILVLGNNKGTEDTRVRDMDHSILFCQLFYDRYKNNEDITLFFMNDVPDLTSFMGDNVKFKELYEGYEKSVPKKNQTKVKASVILNKFLDESFLQARVYEVDMDEFIRHGAYNIPTKSSNLCMEISQPTFPVREISLKRNIKFNSKEDREEFYKIRTEAYYYQVNDKKLLSYQKQMKKLYTFINNDLMADVDERLDYDYFTLDGRVNLSEVGVCILGGINVGHCGTIERVKVVSEYLVRFLDELIDYMDYDLPEVEKAAKMRRPLGIGFSDVFHDLAKNKVFYNTKEGRTRLSDVVSASSYTMIKTSVDLAIEKGACQLFSDTKYSKGILPIDTYNKNVDELVDSDGLDWEWLREYVLKNGMRNSTLMANAPFGSSAMVSNSTSGLEPPRNLAVSKDGAIKLVPDIKTCKNFYTTVWGEDFNNISYIKFIAVAQKYMDQTISFNFYHNLLKTGGKVKKSVLVEEHLTLRYYGGKTRYYINIKSNEQKDGDDAEVQIEIEEDVGGCAGGACHV
jgi:ribonucleoside-diphosphate reductase alpha subunit